MIEQRGSKAFWVTPVIRPGAAAEHAGTSLEERRVLLEGAFPGLVAAVHGKMDVAERQRVLEDFKAGRKRILVATSVIEVGIDVPDASICVIDRPERFGLSQLHQIRGRIGRGPGPSGGMLLCEVAALHDITNFWFF
jgi:ATP-dependent DNA helicase RecG